MLPLIRNIEIEVCVSHLKIVALFLLCSSCVAHFLHILRYNLSLSSLFHSFSLFRFYCQKIQGYLRTKFTWKILTSWVNYIQLEIRAVWIFRHEVNKPLSSFDNKDRESLIQARVFNTSNESCKPVPFSVPFLRVLVTRQTDKIPITIGCEKEMFIRSAVPQKFQFSVTGSASHGLGRGGGFENSSLYFSYKKEVVIQTKILLTELV